MIVCLQDMPGENIAQHLADCAEFIDRALSMRCGMVFIASYLGNRSHAHSFIYTYLRLHLDIYLHLTNNI